MGDRDRRIADENLVQQSDVRSTVPEMAAAMNRIIVPIGKMGRYARIAPSSTNEMGMVLAKRLVEVHGFEFQEAPPVHEDAAFELGKMFDGLPVPVIMGTEESLGLLDHG